LIYLDTSIIVPAYCAEPLSDRVDELLRRESDIAISDLTEVEFYSALSQKVRRRDLMLDEAQQIASDFRSDLNSGIYRRLQVESVHYQQARNWIGQFSTVLRTLDALHLALGYMCQMKVVTGDIGLAKSGQVFGVDVELILP
jgi:predicted nucleic acid-binding protein